MEAFTRDHHYGGTRRKSRERGDHLLGRTAYMHIQAVGTNQPKVIQCGCSREDKVDSCRERRRKSNHDSSQTAGGWALKAVGATKQDFPKVGEQRQRQKNDRMVVKNIADLTALISVWLNVEVKIPKNTLFQTRAWPPQVVTTLNLA